MARTPLMQALVRVYRISRFADRPDIEARNAAEIWNARISRRRLVRGSLMTAGALGTIVADDWLHPKVNATAPPVLIVGAGIAGLTAAYYLDRSGVRVRIVEASQRVGGRILSRAKALDTETTVELGAEFIDSNHQHIRRLVKEFGLVEVDLLAVDRGLKSDILFFNDRAIELKELIPSFVPLAKQIDRDVKAIGDVSYSSANRRARELDRLSIKDYLARYSPDPLLRQFIEIAYRNEYGLEVARQSAINLLMLIGKEKDKIEIFGESDQRYHIRGGNQQIVDHLAEKLRDKIETSTRLESIRSSVNGPYRVSLRENGSSKEYVYDRVILALPFSILRDIDLGVRLPAIKRSAIQEIGYGTNTKIITSYNGRIWKNKHQSNGQSFSNLDTSETWEATRYAAGSQGIITSFSGGDLGLKIGNANPTETSKQIAENLDRIFPGVAAARVGKTIVTDWIASPYVRGSYACYLVGQWTKFAGSEGERVGNLFFIGEHCSTDFQGYMEGGCATGVAAATTILKELRRR
jgi:monoamine oxidase